MIARPLQRIGDRFVVTIPQEEIERRGLQEGQIVGVQFTPHYRDPELRRIMDRFWAEEGEDWLALVRDDTE